MTELKIAADLNSIADHYLKEQNKSFDGWIRESLSKYGIEVPDPLTDEQAKEIITRHNIRIDHSPGFYELKIGGDTIAKRPSHRPPWMNQPPVKPV